MTNKTWINCIFDKNAVAAYPENGKMYFSCDCGLNFYESFRINISDKYSIDFVKKDGSIWMIHHTEEKIGWLKRLFNKRSDTKTDEYKLSEEKRVGLIKFLKEDL